MTNLAGFQSIAESMVLDDRRINEILRRHLNLPEEKWGWFVGYRDLYFTAEEAVDAGLADEIGQFAPPKGATFYEI